MNVNPDQQTKDKNWQSVVSESESVRAFIENEHTRREMQDPLFKGLHGCLFDPGRSKGLAGRSNIGVLLWVVSTPL